jgi:hypothetical protein
MMRKYPVRFGGGRLEKWLPGSQLASRLPNTTNPERGPGFPGPRLQQDFTISNRRRPTNDLTTSGTKLDTPSDPKGHDSASNTTAEDRFLFENPWSDDVGPFDATLMQSIQHDPCIDPENWSDAYRAARRGEPEWWLAVRDESAPPHGTDQECARGPKAKPRGEGVK